MFRYCIGWCWFLFFLYLYGTHRDLSVSKNSSSGHDGYNNGSHTASTWMMRMETNSAWMRYNWMHGTNVNVRNGSELAHADSHKCVPNGECVERRTEKGETVCIKLYKTLLNGAVLWRYTAKDTTAYQLLVLNARVFFMFISCSVGRVVFFFFSLHTFFSPFVRFDRLFTRMPRSSHVNFFCFWLYSRSVVRFPLQEKYWNIAVFPSLSCVRFIVR